MRGFLSVLLFFCTPFPVHSAAKFLVSETPVPGRYIVVLKDSPAVGEHLVRRHGGEIVSRFDSALQGFVLKTTEARARQLSLDDRVLFVEQDSRVRLYTTQANASWGLDRIDQRKLPLSSTYIYDSTGRGVNVYIIDTGIRSTHHEFSGRLLPGFSNVKDGRGTGDCDGHGTHVAAIAGGLTYGVAKGVNLIPVRVLDCDGSALNSDVIEGIDWVNRNHVKPAVVNLSLGGRGSSAALDAAVRNSIGKGILFVVAAGNDNQDACRHSPGRVSGALTVGASTRADTRAAFSNYGACIDLFAPGQDIISATHSSDSSTTILSGTSMSAPHATGAAALFLEQNPDADAATVIQSLIAFSTKTKLTGIGEGSPNRLIYSRRPVKASEDPDAPVVAVTSPFSGSIVNGTVEIHVQATDNTGIAKARVFVDGIVIGTDSAPPYFVRWDTTLSGNGVHTVKAKALDVSGNAGISQPFSVTVQNFGACSSLVPLLQNGDFEEGVTAWNGTRGVIDNSNTYTPHSGSFKAWLNGYGLTRTDSISQQVSIPADACSVRLSFWLWIVTAETTTIEAFDRLEVQILDSAGNVLKTAATYSNLNSTRYYVHKRLDLREFKGETVILRFLGAEDSAARTSFLIDDISLFITQ